MTDEAPSPPSIQLTDDDGNLRPLPDIQREIISAAIAFCGGNKTRAMTGLKLSRATFYRKIKRSA